MLYRIHNTLLLILFVCGELARVHSKGSSAALHRSVRWWRIAFDCIEIYGSDKLADCEREALRNVKLTTKQEKLLRQHGGVFPSVMRASVVALNECRLQMSGRRWNCSYSERGELFGDLPLQPWRESAFLHALTSAALTHQVAGACRGGSIDTCNCGILSRQARDVNEDYINPAAETVAATHRYEGCNDNLEFGSRLSKKFTDRSLKHRDLQSLLRRHNHKAGRALTNLMTERKCRCHGLSGSCQQQVCWNRLKSFGSVARLIRERFDSSVKVALGTPRAVVPNIIASRRFKKQAQLLLPPLTATVPSSPPPTDQDLVYSHDSPAFCSQNTTLGFPGISGRDCVQGKLHTHSCELLCCGRGFSTHPVRTWEKCNCVFEYSPPRVLCKQCLTEHLVNRCR